MINTKKFAAALLAVLMALLFTTEVLAQFPGTGGIGGRSSRGGRSESGRGTIQPPRPSNSGDTFELIEFRLGMLEEDLKLTPAQLKSWDPWAAQMRAIATDLQRERAPAQTLTPPTALQQVNRAVDQARNRLAALEDVAAAAKTLYDVLGSEQRMLVDARFPTIIPLVAGTAQNAAPEGGGRGRPSRDDGAAFTPPSPRLP